jgi:hypothetical protein
LRNSCSVMNCGMDEVYIARWPTGGLRHAQLLQHA